MELDHDGPFDKMEIKKWKQISTSTFAVQVLLDSGNNAQRGEKTTPNYFHVPKS